MTAAFSGTSSYCQRRSDIPDSGPNSRSIQPGDGRPGAGKKQAWAHCWATFRTQIAPALVLASACLKLALAEPAHAATPTEAAAVGLVCQYDPASLCATLHTVTLQQADHYPGSLPANGWTDGRTIWYAPATLTPHNPALSDVDDLAAVLAKEAAQAQASPTGTFTGRTCAAQETVGHQALAGFWTWLWDGSPSHVVYNGLEDAAVTDTISTIPNVSYTCRVLFG